MERLQKIYQDKTRASLKERFGFRNPMEVPRVTKVVINVGVGKFKDDKKRIDAIADDLARITGQAPVKNRARKSIAGFKVREQQVVGLSVTLRGYRMWSFLDKLINVALPRVRDFRGVSPLAFDGRGSYHLGLKEHLVFPEISADSLENVFGLEVSIVTDAGTDEPARELLRSFGFPFKAEEK